MIQRRPVVAGKFYPGRKDQLEAEVASWLEQGGYGLNEPADSVWGVMLPHAGHIYCGRIIGQTLAGVTLPGRLIILCPNHTGYGKPLGVWPEGEWLMPLGSVSVDQKLAAELIGTDCGYQADVASHLGEHSIEVLLPFLQARSPVPAIVPVAVGTRNAALLQRAGLGLAEVLRNNRDAGVIISSDMNHYESHATTIAKDELALAQALAGDAAGLLEVTEKHNISMCGAAALAIALFAAKDLGYAGCALTGHDTSGPVSGDMGHTVGYAGLHLLRKPHAEQI